MTNTVLGIDLGTQALKVVFYDFDRREIVATGSAPLDLRQTNEGVAEQEAHWWLQALQASLATVDPVVRKSARAVSVSGQQHGFVAIDKAGDVLAPVKLWCDTSTGAECTEIMAAVGGREACIQKTGNPILPGYTASKIRWLKKARPSDYDRIDGILLPHDFLNLYLTGERCMEMGDASGTGILDVQRREWSIGFEGNFLIEPKPMEPMKHQYDFDAQTVIGFLRQHGLDGDFKLNIEANHATLAGHSFAHDLRMCADASLLGSIDANRGDPQNGWDTDQFPLDLYDCIHGMMVVLDNGGIGSGGFNFDAKVRRESTDPEDLFIAHIGGMDTFARGLLIAESILADPRMSKLREGRYRSFDSGDGQRFENGELSLAALRDLAANGDEPKQISGKQELLENLINDHIGNAWA